jgi:hypothetical protein
MPSELKSYRNPPKITEGILYVAVTDPIVSLAHAGYRCSPGFLHGAWQLYLVVGCLPHLPAGTEASGVIVRLRPHPLDLGLYFEYF